MAAALHTIALTWPTGASAQVYWDLNSTTAGSSAGTTAAGTWDQATTTAWNTVAAGTGATNNWAAQVSNGGGGTVANFAAGTNATGSYTVTVSGNVGDVSSGYIAGIAIDEGTLTFGGSGALYLRASGIDNNTANLVSFGSGVSINLVSNQTWDTGTGGITASGVVGGTANLTKAGSGTLTLSGTNTYTGVTTLSAGTLSVGTIGNGGVAGNLGQATNAANRLIFNGGELEYTGATGSSNRRFTITAGSTGAIDVTGAATTLTLAGATGTATTGSFSKLGDGILIFSGAQTYTGSTSIGAAGGPSGGTLQYNVANNLSSGAVNIYGGTLSTLTFSDTIGALNLGGGATGTSANVLLGNGSVLTLGGDVTYNATNNPLGATINMSGTTGQLALGANRIFNIGDSANATTDLSVSAIVTGAFGINKQGAGTLALSGVNTFTGVTTLTAGTLSVGTIGNGGVAGNLGQATNAANRIVFNGGTLQYTGATGSSNRAFTINNATTGTIDVSSASATLTLAGATSTATTGALTKTGDGTLVLSGAQTNTGTTTVGAGTLQINASNRLADSSNLVINSPGTFQFDWGALTETVGSLSGDGTLSLRGSTFITNTTANTTFSGTITDSYGNFRKAGTGDLTLSGNSTYTGLTYIDGGTLIAASNGALGGSTYGNVIASGATLGLQGNISLTEGSFSLQGTGDGGVGAINNISGTNTLNAALNFTAATTLGSAGGTLNLTDSLNLSSAVIFTGSGDFNASGQVYGSSSLTKNGTGTLTFSGSQSYSANGGVSLNNGTIVLDRIAGTSAIGQGIINIGDGIDPAGTAILRLNADNQIHDSAGLITIASDGRLDLNGRTESVNLIGGTGEITLGSGALSVGVNSGSSTYNGVISGTGSLTKIGSGSLTLGGANIHTGATNIGTANGASGGTLTYAANNALGSGTVNVYAGTMAVGTYTDTIGALNLGGGASGTTASVTIGNGGALTLGGDLSYNATNNPNGATITGTGTGALGLGASRIFTIGDSSAATDDLTISAIISGPGFGLTKTGAGTLNLSGNNTYTGTTAVHQGTLVIAGQTASATIDTSSGAVTELYVAAGTRDNFTSNTFTGTGTLRKTGAGNITWGAAVGTFALGSGGLVDVQAGSLIAGNQLAPNNENFTSNLADLNVAAGASFLGGAAHARFDALSGGGTIQWAWDVANTSFTFGVDNGSGNFTGVMGDYTGRSASYTKDGTGTQTLSGNSTYTGTTTVADGILLANHNNALGAATGNVTVDSGATLSVGGGRNVTRSTGTLFLAGAGETGQLGALQAGGTAGQTSQYTGNITLTANATIGAANNLLIVGDDYDFDNRITLGSHTLTLSTTSATGVVPSYASYPSYILDSSNLYISSTITGTGGVTKTGDGTANLIFFPSSAGVSAYTGDTLVTGGKLIIDGSDHAGIVSSNITVGNASSPGGNDSVILQMGQLSSASASYIVGDYSNITNVATSSMTIYEDGLFNMNRANNALNNLTLQGGHVTGWSGGSSYALLTVTGGITTLASSESSIIDNGELGLSANGFSFTVADGAATDDLRVDSIVHNGIGFTGTDADVSLTKTGTGTLAFTNANDYQGVTQIQQGVLVIRNNDGLGAYGPSVSSLDNGTVVSSGAQLQLQQTTGGANLTVGSVSGTETLTLNGTGISSTGALYNATGDNTYHGFVRLASDSRITAASGTTLTISNTLGTEAGILNGTGGGGQDLAVGGPGNVTIGSAVGGLVGDLSKDGSGTLTLAGNNSYAGTTTVGTGGAIKVTHNQGLAGTAVTVNSGGALQFAQNALNQNLTAISGPSGSTTISGTGLSNGGAIQNLNGSNTYLAGVTLGANSRITADSGSSLTLSGNITGAGYALDAGGAGNTTYNGVISGSGTSFTKTDSGTVTLGGTSANTFSGALSVNDGTLNLNKTAGVNAVGTSTTITIGDNVGAALSATLALQQSNQMPDTTDITINSDGRLSMGSASDAISQIAGTGQIDLGSSGHLTIGTDNSSSTFNGTFANSATGSFTKAGTGSLTFTQDISYNGTFNLGGGTLVLDNMDLSVTNLNITANSTIDFGATGDSHIFAGTLDFLNTSVTLNIINWTKGVDAFYATFWPGATSDLLNNGNTAPMNQIIFAGWDQSDTGWDSYDNQIYPKVPEPSTYGLMFVGACSAFFAFRRWRNAKLASTKSTR